MQTLGRLEDKLGLVPAAVVPLLGRVDEGRGREELHTRQRPTTLKRLVQVARVQSAEASNALEGVTAPAGRVRDLMAERTDPRTRSEAEIAGYRAALDLIHRSAPNMPFTTGVVMQLHRDLYQFTPEPGGRWKTSDNRIEERRPDGTESVIVETVSFAETSAAMEELHRRTREAWEKGGHHRLLLTGAYVLDFLAIHPFRDGNGRMARLLTLLLLYQAGYGVGRYVSLEKLVEGTKDSYYETLRGSSVGWHQGAHDPWPWLRYFLGILVGAYAQLEDRVGTLGGRGAKLEAIEAFVRNVPVGATFRVSDVRQRAAGAGDSHVSKVLARLRDQGLIVARGRGQGAHWERLDER
jgi:Fic family protein